VILNLVRNAVEAMESVDRRELRISTGLLADNTAQVSVIDSGPGIPPEIASRLFQPFVTSKKSGMGLGLSICREIVEAHHGRLQMAPIAAGGTEFRLILPTPPDEEVAGGG
jgi:two-component system sensor kinase FixL